MKTSVQLIIAATLLGTTVAPSIARAEDETAEAAYKRGQTALKAGRVVEACEAFATSDKLTPKVETKLSLAECLEKDGKLVSAAALYRSTAESDTNKARAKKSNDKATKLEAKAPKLRFAINPAPEGLKLQVDGKDVPADQDLRVDIGAHEVTATAPGFTGKANAAVDGSRPIIDVIVRLEAVAPPPPEKPVVTTPPPVETKPVEATPAPQPEVQPEPAPVQDEGDHGSGSHRKRNGVIFTVAGAGLAIGAGVMLGLAASKFSTESDLCPDARCANDMDLARANALLDNGTTLRNVGIGVGIGGVALLAVGGYLLLTGDEKPAVSLQVGGGSTGLSFNGSF